MHASEIALIGTAKTPRFPIVTPARKPSRDSTFGEAHISYMKKIGAVFPAFLTSLTPQADVFHAVHCRF